MDPTTPSPEKRNPWLPTGQLSHGTLLFGPVKSRPENLAGAVVEVTIDGRVWFVVISGEKISAESWQEFHDWARKRVAGYEVGKEP